MNLKRDRPEPIEQRDAGNVRCPSSRSAILRKRILAAFALVLMVLVFAIHTYHRSAGDWRWFWVGEIWLFLSSCRASERDSEKGHEIYRCDLRLLAIKRLHSKHLGRSQ